MIRDDLSDKLVHLVRGDTVGDAFKKFQSIIREGRLRGGNGYIKGGYKCVCFTDTPISKLGYVLANPDPKKMRYRPIGIMVDKKYVFEAGGRPVIYQPDIDFEKLPDALRYRHVRFELDRPEGAVDFTWEREWRLRADELTLPRDSTTVVLPNRDWRDILVEDHITRIQDEVRQLGSDAALAIEAYPWHIIVLEDLGIPIPDGL
ncbi:hypothetical protein J5226_20175 [Lysobacter sp. K5869]|uniref:hypothetical protein n=1 Tax=Lysobacter sp. K5869 TaxID=2820808 RepID=UPI001C062627|nr:hypothetical protein [Lysobacter sp. K5869]QWP75900.1 hypothetical protein J5226_20175 [Lysobacter sp. K5869]